MSTYLLLRNNKETGPFTLDEIKGMSLMAFDLVWIEGKSAAWRYPGEISEFSSFAPPAPEQPFARFYKKAGPASSPSDFNANQSGSPSKEIRNRPPESLKERSESFSAHPHPDRENNLQPTKANPIRNGTGQSIYIHLPSPESTGAGFTPSQIVQGIGNPGEEISADRGSSPRRRSSKRSGKILRIGSVMLMFCAGLFIGFYLSNRRNFYSLEGNSSRIIVRPVKFAGPPTPMNAPVLNHIDEQGHQQVNPESNAPESDRSRMNKSKKKAVALPLAGKDTLRAATVQEPDLNMNKVDSARNKQDLANKHNALAAKIRTHPEEYLLIGVGNYKIGLLGGISEIPFTLTNRSGADMDLVVIAVDYWLRNKKIFKTENLSFHQVAAGAVLTSIAPKSTRGLKISYRLTIANAQQLGMSYSNL